MPTTFSSNHHIDIEEDLLLLLYLLNHHHHLCVSRLNNILLNDIYLRVNLLILWWMLLTHWAPWMLRIALFVSLFWQLLAALTAMLFIEKRSVLKGSSQIILNFRCVVQRALSHCRLQTIFLNPCEFFLLRPMSMPMERSFESTGLRIFKRTFDHIIMRYLSSLSMSNSIESSSILWMRWESISFEFRVLFIILWTIFFLLSMRDLVLHRFIYLTLLKSNCNFGMKLTQICNSIFFNCWIQSFERSILISNFGEIQSNELQRIYNWLFIL